MTNKSRKSGRKRDWVTEKAAEITGFKEDYVRKVRNGDRNNETILTVVLELIEGNNKLVEKVKKLVPINNTIKRTPIKYGDIK